LLVTESHICSDWWLKCFCKVPVRSIRFLTMAGFLIVGLFECGIYFWTGEELMSEVSSTSGTHCKNGSIGIPQNISCVCYDIQENVLFYRAWRWQMLLTNAISGTKNHHLSSIALHLWSPDHKFQQNSDVASSMSSPWKTTQMLVYTCSLT